MAIAQGIQLRAQPLLQAGPGAEQGQAGMHLQQQGARIVQADLRAEAVGPGGEELLAALHGGQVVVGSGEVATEQLGGVQRHAGAQAEFTRRRVERLQHAAIGRPAEQCQRRLRVVALAQGVVQRQLRQENAGPAHLGLRVRWRAPAPGRRGT